MKNFQAQESLMKISPLSDVYHAPKQTYTNKGGWFGLCEEPVDGGKTQKTSRKASRKA